MGLPALVKLPARVAVLQTSLLVKLPLLVRHTVPLVLRPRGLPLGTFISKQYTPRRTVSFVALLMSPLNFLTNFPMNAVSSRPISPFRGISNPPCSVSTACWVLHTSVPDARMRWTSARRPVSSVSVPFLSLPFKVHGPASLIAPPDAVRYLASEPTSFPVPYSNGITVTAAPVSKLTSAFPPSDETSEGAHCSHCRSSTWTSRVVFPPILSLILRIPIRVLPFSPGGVI